MPMFSLLYPSKNVRKTTGSFWNYYPDKPSSAYSVQPDNQANNIYERTKLFYSIKNSESFDYKNKIVRNLPAVDHDAELEDIKIIVPLKNLSNFIFSLKFLMINTEIELILKWSQNCILIEKGTREFKALVSTQAGGIAAQPQVNAVSRPASLKFTIADCKLYITVVTLQEKYDNELLEALKPGIDIDFEWKRYRIQIINQPTTNNLNLLIAPTFNNVNKLFVLAIPNEKDRTSFSKYYTPTVEIKDYNVLIDLQPFFDIPIKNKEQNYKAITELTNHNNCTTGNSLTYEYFCNHYKLIAIDLSKENAEFKNQQINFVGRLEQNATIFVIIEELLTTRIKFEQNTLSII